MAEIGKDCHITLAHPAVNNGEPVGFLLDEEENEHGALVSVQRETDSNGQTRVRLFFDVLLAERLVNPDGSAHAASRAEMYAALNAYLRQTSGVAVACSAGVFANVGALGYSAAEMHYPRLTVVACQLNNTGPYFAAVAQSVYDNAVWDGVLAWDAAVWR